MALNLEQRGRIVKILEEKSIFDILGDIEKKFAKHVDLNNFSEIHIFSDSILANSELENPDLHETLELMEKAIEEEIQEVDNHEEVDKFLIQLMYLKHPYLYNFFKAKCFIDIGNEIKDQPESHPIYITHEHSDVKHVFNDCFDYYKFEVNECREEFYLITDIDTELNEYVEQTGRVIEEMCKSPAIHDEL